MELPGSCYQDCECPKWLDFQVSSLFDLLRGWTWTIWKVWSLESLRLIVSLFKNDLSVWIRRTDPPQPVLVPVRSEEVSWLLWSRWVLTKVQNQKSSKNTVTLFGKFNRYQNRSHFDAWRVQEETLYPKMKISNGRLKATWCGKTIAKDIAQHKYILDSDCFGFSQTKVWSFDERIQC